MILWKFVDRNPVRHDRYVWGDRPRHGEIPRREFGMDFIAPAGKCYYQKLVLELPAQTAPETEVRGRASYADLDLQMKSPPRDN